MPSAAIHYQVESSGYVIHFEFFRGRRGFAILGPSPARDIQAVGVVRWGLDPTIVVDAGTLPAVLADGVAILRASYDMFRLKPRKT